MDLILRNAEIFDGSGMQAFHGDVAVRGGRIAAVGKIEERAAREIDVAGLAVAPGFIDIHTHYDAQIFWDPYLTPSIFHGVTTVIAGNCGFTLAPLSGRDEDAAYLVRMLSRVEGMPLSTLQQSLKPDWTSFGEFLNRVDGQVALNTAFMVGHSTLRRTVMGEGAVGREASEAEIRAMSELLRASLKAGGMGLSTTVADTHNDYEGNKVPSRWATREEMIRLAKVVGEFPGTWLEIVLAVQNFGEAQYSLMTDMSVAAGRFLNWNFLATSSKTPEATRSQLRASDYARERGGKVVALVQSVPAKNLLNFVSGMILDTLPGWAEVLRLPADEKIRALSDPTVRAELAKGPKLCDNELFSTRFADWAPFLLDYIESLRQQEWVGKTLGEYATAVGKDPFNALLDLVVENRLKVSFSAPANSDDPESWRVRACAWLDDRCVVGASDAGAHLDMINTFAFSTQLLGEGVRKRGLLSMEEGIRRLTAVPAEKFGLADRGFLKPGAHADIVVLDRTTVECGPVVSRYDLPGDEMRLYAEARGIHHVFVNGVQVVEYGETTGRRGGRVLRSGTDTITVPLV